MAKSTALSTQEVPLTGCPNSVHIKSHASSQSDMLSKNESSSPSVSSSDDPFAQVMQPSLPRHIKNSNKHGMEDVSLAAGVTSEEFDSAGGHPGKAWPDRLLEASTVRLKTRNVVVRTIAFLVATEPGRTTLLADTDTIVLPYDRMEWIMLCMRVRISTGGVAQPRYVQTDDRSDREKGCSCCLAAAAMLLRRVMPLIPSAQCGVANCWRGSGATQISDRVYIPTVWHDHHDIYSKSSSGFRYFYCGNGCLEILLNGWEHPWLLKALSRLIMKYVYVTYVRIYT